MSWLKELDKATDHVETPRSFIFWSGLATISALAAPNVFLDVGGAFRLKPNLFVLLSGRPGLGKGLPIAIAAKLALMVDATRVFTGRITIQKMIQELSLAYTQESTKQVVKDARGFLVSGEFATALQRDPDGLTIMTDLFDAHFHPKWRNLTKMGNSEVLINPCLTLLGGVNPETFDEYVPKYNLYGGFISRTFIVHEDKRHRVSSLVNKFDPTQRTKAIDFEELSQHLIEISKIKGEFEFTIAGAEVFDDWYNEFRPKEIEDKTGTIDRLPDHVRKVSMLLSLSKRTDLLLGAEDVQEAIKYCLGLFHSTKKMSAGKGQSSFAAQTKRALDILTRSSEFKLTRQDLLVKGFGDFDASDLDRIIETLIQTGFVKQVGEKNIIYQVTVQGQELWKKIDAGEKTK